MLRILRACKSRWHVRAVGIVGLYGPCHFLSKCCAGPKCQFLTFPSHDNVGYRKLARVGNDQSLFARGVPWGSVGVSLRDTLDRWAFKTGVNCPDLTYIRDCGTMTHTNKRGGWNMISMESGKSIDVVMLDK